MKIFVVGNPKGGAGKTHAAMLLAEVLHHMGLVGFVIDGDRQKSAFKWEARGGSLPRFPVRVEQCADVDRMTLVEWLDQRWWLDNEKREDKVDYVIIDTRPDLNDVMLQSALEIADTLIIPVVPEVVFIEALEPFMPVIKKANELRAEAEFPPIDARVLVTRLKANDADAKKILAELPPTVELCRNKFGIDLKIMDNVFKESTYVRRASNYKTGLFSLGKSQPVRAVQDNLREIYLELVQ